MKTAMQQLKERIKMKFKELLNEDISFEQFRSRAIQSLSLLKGKDKAAFKSKDDIENWIKKEWERHNSKKN